MFVSVCTHTGIGYRLSSQIIIAVSTLSLQERSKQLVGWEKMQNKPLAGFGVGDKREVGSQ